MSRWTHIPVSKLLEGEVQKLLHLREALHKRVIGQDEAVEAVVEAVVRARSGLKDPNRPIGSQGILAYRGAFDGREYERMKEAVPEELRRPFRPEFLNRVDEIIVFHALSEEHLLQIVDIQLEHLCARLRDRHIQIELTPEARCHLVRIGYDPVYGARPLKRAIQKNLETQLGFLLLEGKMRDGQTVLVDYDRAGEKLVFTPQPSPAAAEAAAAKA